MTRHIRLINIGYPPFTGGAQTYVTLLAESLAARGDHASVFTTDAGEVADQERQRLPGVRVAEKEFENNEKAEARKAKRQLKE